MAVSLAPLGIKVCTLFPDVAYSESVDELSGTAPAEFHSKMAEFIRSSGTADAAAKKLIEGVKTGRFFINGYYPGYKDSLIAWVNNDLDPFTDWITQTRG